MAFGTLSTVYVVLYVLLTLPFEKNLTVFVGGMALPGLIYVGWKMFEAIQSGGKFSVYAKVMGRWYFLLWGIMALPCAVMANFGTEWAWIAAAVMLILPTVIWTFMFFWTNTAAELLDKGAYDSYRRAGRDVWSTTSDLNWDDPSTHI